MAAETPSTAGTQVSLEVAAQLITVTPRWVQKLAKDGWIPATGMDGSLEVEVGASR